VCTKNTWAHLSMQQDPLDQVSHQHDHDRLHTISHRYWQYKTVQDQNSHTRHAVASSFPTSPPKSNVDRVHRRPNWLQWDDKSALSPSTITTPSNITFTPIPQPTHSPPQMASGSNQPFYHNTLSRQTNRQTDRWDRRQLCTKSTYALLY